MISNKTLQIVFDLVGEVGIDKAAEQRNVTVETILDYLYRYESRTEDNLDVITANVQAKKQTQKYQDNNRIERKAFRDYVRVENAVTELNTEFVELLKQNSFNTFQPRVQPVVDDGGFGIIQFSDWHINELVCLPTNRYDIGVAAARGARFVNTAIADFKSKGVKHLLVACTGDMINSDRRLDEKLNMATNRVRAQFLAVELFKQMIEELSAHFTIHVAAISGNESRVNDDWEWSEACVTDNYDYSIHNILRLLLASNKNITFCGDCVVEKVINFGGKNILLIHGNQLGKNYDTSIAKVKARYAHHNVIVDYVLFGHFHETHISALYARSGSPVGANAYSENGLQLSSAASQNIYFIHKDGIDGRQILLQDVEGVVPYDLHNELMQYNAKSADKTKNPTVVFQVVI